MIKLKFSSSSKIYSLPEGTELSRTSYIDPSIPLKFGCCKGQCGTCAIKVIEGEENLSPKTKEEILTLNRLKLHSHRLACQCAVKGDIEIESRC